MLQIFEEREEVIEILRSVRRLCEKVVKGRPQELLSELITMWTHNTEQNAEQSI